MCFQTKVTKKKSTAYFYRSLQVMHFHFMHKVLDFPGQLYALNIGLVFKTAFSTKGRPTKH